MIRELAAVFIMKLYAFSGNFSPSDRECHQKQHNQDELKSSFHLLSPQNFCLNKTEIIYEIVSYIYAHFNSFNNNYRKMLSLIQ
jgi:hypothetical protein